MTCPYHWSKPRLFVGRSNPAPEGNKKGGNIGLKSEGKYGPHASQNVLVEMLCLHVLLLNTILWKLADVDKNHTEAAQLVIGQTYHYELSIGPGTVERRPCCSCPDRPIFHKTACCIEYFQDDKKVICFVGLQVGRFWHTQKRAVPLCPPPLCPQAAAPSPASPPRPAPIPRAPMDG